jgi:nucleoside-diphosphate-sugar epimerase
MVQSGAGEHVLLTGANGFVASHILSILIEVSHIIAYQPEGSKV